MAVVGSYVLVGGKLLGAQKKLVAVYEVQKEADLPVFVSGAVDLTGTGVDFGLGQIQVCNQSVFGETPTVVSVVGRRVRFFALGKIQMTVPASMSYEVKLSLSDFAEHQDQIDPAQHNRKRDTFDPVLQSSTVLVVHHYPDCVCDHFVHTSRNRSFLCFQKRDRAR